MVRKMEPPRLSPITFPGRRLISNGPFMESTVSQPKGSSNRRNRFNNIAGAVASPGPREIEPGPSG